MNLGVQWTHRLYTVEVVDPRFEPSNKTLGSRGTFGLEEESADGCVCHLGRRWLACRVVTLQAGAGEGGDDGVALLAPRTRRCRNAGCAGCRTPPCSSPLGASPCDLTGVQSSVCACVLRERCSVTAKRSESTPHA